MKRKVAPVLLLLIFSWTMGCTNKSDGDDYARKLVAAIRVGSSQAEAEQVLDQYGFTHSFDLKTTTIYAMKRGGNVGLVRQDWSAEVTLSEDKKVTSVKVEKVFTGP